MAAPSRRRPLPVEEGCSCCSSRPPAVARPPTRPEFVTDCHRVLRVASQRAHTDGRCLRPCRITTTTPRTSAPAAWMPPAAAPATREERARKSTHALQALDQPRMTATAHSPDDSLGRSDRPMNTHPRTRGRRFVTAAAAAAALLCLLVLVAACG